MKKLPQTSTIPIKDKKYPSKNLYVSQGWFDSSVCLGEPGYEDRETIKNGLQTAAMSGFTGIAVNPNTLPTADSKADIQFLLSKAAGNPVSVYPIGALTKEGNGTDLAELFDMKNAGAVAFYDYQKAVKNPLLLKLALQYTCDFDGLVIAFCNDSNIAGNGIVNEEVSATKLGLKGIPALAEELHLVRNIYLLEYTDGKLHVPTVSTEKSIKLIKEAKSKGLDITCSVSVNNLVLNDDELSGFDTNLKLLPPLRTQKSIKN